MIKLNSKNITYVALADTNNSLKAPKEIWYADSNNSVKLVYQRKDALIEGEDYEKYHWLLTDAGNPYLQVDDTCNTDENAYIETTYKSKYTNSGTDMFIGFSINETNNIGLRIFNSAYNGGSTYVDYHKTENGVLSSYRVVQSQSNINAERYIKATFNNLIIDTTEYQSINWGSGFDNLKNPVTRLHTNQHLDNDVRYKRTKLRVNFKEHDLIPCKLLKPVPKWLDANGIRRQVGECGMIDLVSGKFYGNVNSVGTFTVENYYERKEWLVAQTTEKVTMMVLPLRTSDFKYSIRLLDRVPNLSYFTTGWHTYGVSNTQTLVFIYDRKNSTKVYSCQTGFQLGDIIMIDSTAEDLLFNNISIPKYGFPADNFIIQTNNNVALNMIVSSITVNDKERYIPCTLTMDLPASMDANNIARTKGESGMWDLVSDKFYGNVANSGTFKAVNLAEGVDYEVHQWLTSNTGIPMLSTSINLYKDTLEVKFIPTSEVGTKLIWSSMAELDTQSGDTIECRCIIGSQNELSIRHGIRDSNPHSIFGIASQYKNNEYNVLLYPENNYIKGNVNGTAVAEYSIDNRTNIDTIMYIYTYSAKIGLFSVGNVHLIPVKLLKSIPSKYDANGIARQVGECGMYDTVNDVFYGNVASSGTFSVSDDS